MANHLAMDEILKITNGMPIFHAILTLDNYFTENSILAENKTIRIGEANTVHFEKLRLKSYPDIKFNNLDIDGMKPCKSEKVLRENNNLIDLKSNSFSLYQSKKLFEPEFMKALHLQIKNKDFQLVEFINIFNHICISLYYQVWLKSNPDFYRHLRSKEISVRSGFYFTGFNANNHNFSKFTSQNRSLSALKNMLLEYIKHPLKIVENVLEEIKPSHDKIYDPITNSLVLGDKEGIPMWDSMPVIHTKFSIIIGPLTHKEYRKFVPWGPNFRGLCRLTEDYLDSPWLNYDIEFLVTDIPQETDLSDQGFVIGFDMWMKENENNPTSRKYKPYEREIFENEVRSEYGVTSVKNGDWPSDIYISELNWVDPTPDYFSLLLETSNNKPDYFYSEISTSEEKKQDQAIKYFDKKKDVLASMFREYASEFPRSARAISLDANGHIGDTEPSQFVHFFAFVSGLIRHKIDRTNEDRLLEIARELNPNVFLSLPATMIVNLKASEEVKKCTLLPRETEITLKTNGNEVKKFQFKTCYDTVLIPAKITKIHCTRAFMGEHLREDLFNRAATTLVIDLESHEEEITFENMGLEFLRLYINLKSTKASMIFHELIFTNCVGMDVYDTSHKRNGDGFLGYIPPCDLHPVGFAENEEVIPRPFKQENNHNTPARHFMREFSLYPEKFMFFDIKNLKKLIKGCGNKVQIRLFLDHYINYKLLLHINTTQNCLQIGATPMVNLFKAKTHIYNINKNTTKVPVLDMDDIKQKNNKIAPHHVTNVNFKLFTNFIPVKHKSNINNRYTSALKWNHTEPSLFTDPFDQFSSIEIINSNSVEMNTAGGNVYIDCIAHNKIEKQDFSEFPTEVTSFNLEQETLIESIFINQHSFTPTRENPHLLKGPYPFLQNLSMRHFFHSGNNNHVNIIQYLKPFISIKDDVIDQFTYSLEDIKTSVITGEGKLPPKQTKMFITNGMKFCFEFSGLEVEHRKRKRTNIYLLMHIISEHLAEMCSNLSFVKVSYRYTEPFQEEEKYFNKRIYLGKRCY